MDEVTCGGNALRFYAAVRLRLSRMGLIKTEDKVGELLNLFEVLSNLEEAFAKNQKVNDLACKHGFIMKDEGNYFIE
jgi:recombination protein RecA